MTPQPTDLPRVPFDVRELVAEVERLLDIARESKEDFGAVNWGDLGVIDVEYRLSLLNPPRLDPFLCVVMIEEASPHCGLAHWIWERLDHTKFPNCWVECEW